MARNVETAEPDLEPLSGDVLRTVVGHVQSSLWSKRDSMVVAIRWCRVSLGNKKFMRLCLKQLFSLNNPAGTLNS